MKKTLKLISAAMCVVMLVVFGMGMGLTGLPAEAAEVTLSRSSKLLTPGESYTLKITGADKADIDWNTSDSAVAEVKNGKVTAVAAGKATITAKTGGQSYDCAITVSLNRIKRSKSTIRAGEKLQAQLIGKTDRMAIEWLSADEKIATVNASGIITGVSPGTVKITASTGTVKKSFMLTVTEYRDLTAAEIVDEIKIGWNLGNTFDANSNLGPDASIEDLETAWCHQVTTEENFLTLKKAGFNTIRIPVSWAKCADKNDNYKIRADWMARVKEVVDYAYNNGMYVILNTHHDHAIFKVKDAEMKETKKAFKSVWKQIAKEFKDYDYHLIFEGLNEPRTPGSPKEWQGGTPEEHNNINELHQLFVDTIRASGGKNKTRALLLATYAASVEAPAINGFVLPKDTVKDMLIVSLHTYAPYEFALSTNVRNNKWSIDNPEDVGAITRGMDRGYDAFVSKGIPVILGEFGAMNKDNEAVRAKWAEFYVSYAKSKGMKCVWWDNHVFEGGGEKFGLLDREKNIIVYPKVVDGLMKGAK